MNDIHDPVLYALGNRIGAERAEELIARTDRYTNLPNMVAGYAKLRSDPEVERAALEVVEDSTLAGALGLGEPEAAHTNTTETPAQIRDALRQFAHGDYLPSEACWALLTLAARADLTVLDRLDPRVAAPQYATRLIAKIRRAAVKHQKELAAGGGSADAPNVPQKVSEVKRWLAEHPDVDPAVLAPRGKGRAATRAAAIRALGQIGTSEALEVLSQYASDEFTEPELKEINSIWGNFDRKAFAAAVFRPNAHLLDIGTVKTIEGVDGITGLTSLKVVFDGDADLSPLAGCVHLQRFEAVVIEPHTFVSVEALAELPQLNELSLSGDAQGADLSFLAKSSVRKLGIRLEGTDASYLFDMPNLEYVSVGERWKYEDHDGSAREIAFALVRAGIKVRLYSYQDQWVPGVIEAAKQDPGIKVIDIRGLLELVKA